MAKPSLHLEKFLPYRLSVVTNRISGALSRHYADRFGIGIPEWRVIANLGRTPGLTANAVVERSAMDKVTVSRAVAALEAKGLLTRERDAGDKRKSRLTLSTRGQTVYAEIAPLALGFERDLLTALTADETAQLDRIIDKLNGKMDGL
ncbi:MAG: MarR family winged helix-turn-helix transcriptional regulator [Ferrovibrio sp.]|uniref:MarR family winged helix-turn-helix transcriptional regulator n=1 Tax=Ferrovibrio sp. TaxID=1917215 RepID=UPI0026129E0E|nr:MarR family winged helix-turn-helix transcriptional regulator [Ferrovibrio sp.]MCW0232614.1 MarR family winged helix-turn-helix transcriptional regulator [Ferrovibrio sp.]